MRKYIGGIGDTSAFVDKLKGIVDIIVAFGICAFPTPLLKKQDEFIIKPHEEPSKSQPLKNFDYPILSGCYGK